MRRERKEEIVSVVSMNSSPNSIESSTDLHQRSCMAEVLNHLAVLSRTRWRFEKRGREDDGKTLGTHAYEGREKNA